MASWFITGCSTGLGRAFAEAVLAHGDNAAVTARDATQVQDLADAYPDRALALELDVTNDQQVIDAVTAAQERFGTIDVLVNNAGYGLFNPIASVSEAEFDDVMGINLKGAFFGVQAAARQMIAQGGGGVVVNMSSVNALLAIPSLATYAMSKGAMKQLTSVAAVALAPHGIRVEIGRAHV